MRYLVPIDENRLMRPAAQGGEDLRILEWSVQNSANGIPMTVSLSGTVPRRLIPEIRFPKRGTGHAQTGRAIEKSCRASSLGYLIVSGACVSCKLKRDFLPLDSETVLPAYAESLSGRYTLCPERLDKLRLTGDDDFSFALPGFARFRVSTYK
jgi:hypothetical protein